MRGFMITLLMVMMVCLMAPMTVMAHGGMAEPVLTVTMAKWSDVLTTKQGVEQPRPHEGKITVGDSYGMTIAQAIIGARGTKIDYSDISETAHATDGKAGGAAIFASGKPRLSPFNFKVI